MVGTKLGTVAASPGALSCPATYAAITRTPFERPRAGLTFLFFLGGSSIQNAGRLAGSIHGGSWPIQVPIVRTKLGTALLCESRRVRIDRVRFG